MLRSRMGLQRFAEFPLHPRQPFQPQDIADVVIDELANILVAWL